MNSFSQLTNNSQMMAGFEAVALALGKSPKELLQITFKGQDTALAYNKRHAGEYPPMPRPRRYADAARQDIAKLTLGPYYPAFESALASPGLIVQSLVQQSIEGKLPASVVRLFSPDFPFAEHVALQALAISANDCIEARFQRRSGAIIDVAPELHELLLQSDVGERMPMSQLRMPYSACYFHLPPDASGLKFRSSQGVLLEKNIDGFYVLEDRPWDEKNGAYAENSRVLTIMLVMNASKEMNNAFDVASSFMRIWVDDEDANVADTIEDNMLRFEGFQTDPVWRESARSVFEYLAKCLCYMSMADYRRQLVPERSEAERKLRGTPPGLIRRKREEKAERTYDRIVIGAGIERPIHEEPQGDDAGQDRARAVHWRRGHFRGQRVGEGRTGLKTVWIRPTLVGARPDDGNDVVRKNYVLKP